MSGPFRYTTPAPPRSATGRTAAVYAQLAEDFGIEQARPFVVLSSVPAVMTAAWALMRESLIAGSGSRTGRELVAAGVSAANRCPFCVGAHTMLLHATGDHALAERLARGERPVDVVHERLLAWGEASRVPGHPGLWPAPFPVRDAPGHIGTALAFHFINRVVSALVKEDLLPGRAERLRMVRSLAGRSMAATVRRPVAPGAALVLLDETAGGPRWAVGTTVSPAYAALRAAAGAGAGLLDEDDLDLVTRTVAAWDGSHPPLVGAGIPDRSRPGARLVLLSALAPYRIADEDVSAWRTSHHTDGALVQLIAYGAFTAVDRIESALGVPAFGPAGSAVG